MTDSLASRAGGQPAQMREQSFIRPLAFSEALKFTPMTTSPLHPSDQIPLPAVEPAAHRVSLASQSERKAVAGLKITSDVQNELRHLLQARDLSEFKFKKQPTVSKPTAQSLGLSSLARNVYNGSPLDYQYQPELVSPAEQRKPVGPTTERTNSASYNRNSSLETPSAAQSVSTPDRLVLDIQQPPGFRREDYAAAPDSPKRRKLQHNDRDAQLALRQRTQKEQGDAAVFQFQDQLVGIFETRDRIEEDDSAIFSNNFFEPADDDDDFKMQFTTSELAKLQTRLKELFNLKRLDDISNDHIDQLRQLCEGPVQRSQALNLRLSQDPSTDDVEVWQSRIRSAEIGAASASVILLTALAVNAPDLSPNLLLAIRFVVENAFDSCLIPVIESRPDDQLGTLFSFAAANAASLRSLLDTCKKLLDQLVTTCVQLKEAAECLNATEFLAARLIFVQNGATDKVAALGVKTYERTRKQVMSYLARLFVAFPAERKTIMDEILSSVDKLPSTSRSARQYSLGDGKSIMLVTALFVQLVQSSALGDRRRKVAQRTNHKNGALDDDDYASSEDEEDEENVKLGDDDELSRLRSKAEELLNPALRTSAEIVQYLVGKASKVTKTGDSPYRNILDLFIEDLLMLLPQPDWPAAQVLLETLYQKMTGLVQHEKAAGVKNMALESLGAMGAAIATAKASAQVHATAISRESADGSEFAQSLSRLAHDHFARGLTKEELLGPDGPLALTCRYYNLQDGNKENKSLRARSAQSFFLAQYASWYCRHMIPQPGEEIGESTRSGAVDLLEEINGVISEVPSSAFLDSLQPREAVLAYLLSTLSSTFCRRYETIAQTLLASLSSDQAQVRSRSLKSITTMLETDLSLLEMQNMRVEQYVFPCASDDSAAVRDSALNLIAKFLISKPAYEERGIRKLIQCTRDGKVGVQKRSIGHLADVYAQDERPALKAKIAETILRRTADIEESVSNLAKDRLADAWFTACLSLAGEDPESAKTSVAIEELTLHIATTLEHGLDELPQVLTRFISGQLKLSKTSTQLGVLLDRIVGILFNMIVAGKAKRSSLQLLVCLAQARPEAIAPTQLSHLRQYIKNIATGEDLMMFKAVLGIFHYVLPRLSISHQDLLANIQSDLFLTVSRLALRSDLDSVMSCLRTIVDVIKSGARFVQLLKQITTKVADAEVDDASRKRFVFIIGSVAKYIDVDSLPAQGHLDIRAAGSVSGFLADLLYPFAARKGSDDLQQTTLESLGCVCQAWPAQFEKRKIRDLFLHCLGLSADSKARSIALRTFEELFARWGDDGDEDEDEKDKEKTAPLQDLKKMGGNAKVQSDNSAIAGIAPAVFDRVKKIALSTGGPELVLAARTVASMTKRGTFHPHDYADVYLALETSEVAEVRSILEQAHSKAHTKNETRWAGEYMLAVKKAFKYQLLTAEDPSGSRQGAAKLSACFKIINTSGSKYVRQFLSSLIKRLSFETSKVDTKQKVPTYVLFVRFVVQNLAFFDYARQEDLLHAIQQLELVFGKNGSEISEAIETSLPIEPTPADYDGTEANDGLLENGTASVGASMVGEAHVSAPPAPARVADIDLLQRLAAAACAITMVSDARSHLKRQYGITRDAGTTLAQSKQTKEAGKPPSKVHGITGERFLNSTNGMLLSMETPEAMLNRCREFHRLMSIDEDVVVGEEGDGTRDGRFASMDTDGDMLAPPSRGKKRKSTGSTGGTPRKRGQPRKNATPTRRSSSVSSRDNPDADFMG